MVRTREGAEFSSEVTDHGSFRVLKTQGPSQDLVQTIVVLGPIRDRELKKFILEGGVGWKSGHSFFSVPVRIQIFKTPTLRIPVGDVRVP